MRRRVPLRLGPPPEPPAKPKPFTLLKQPRFVPAGLPSDLAAWYVRHEGVGREASPEKHPVRLHRLAELTPITGPEIWPAGDGEYPAWEAFRGWRVALGSFFENFVYVSAGGDFRFGTILVIGPDVPDNGVLILAVNFGDWFNRLLRDDWVEWGLGPGGFKDLPRGKAEALRRHFARLNPRQPWWNDVAIAPQTTPTSNGGTDGG